MRVLLLNQAFYPDMVATAQHAWDLAKHLRSRGHQVTAIASRATYGHRGQDLPKSEVAEGVVIRRVGGSRFGKGSILGRIVDFAEFHVRSLLAALTLPRQDVVVCFTTPPFIAIVGITLRMLRGSRTVYWCMDLYPDLPVACGVMRPGSFATRCFESVNRYCLRRSDAIVVLGRCMLRRVLAKGIPPQRVSLIRPWSEDLRGTGTSEDFRKKWSIGNRLLVMYSGNFGLGHDFGTIANGAAMCAESGDFAFAFVGGGKRKQWLLDSLAANVGSSFVVDAPYQPRESLGDLLACADVHLVSLSSGVEGIMVPSKIYGILAAGRPVVYVGNPGGEVALAISEIGCGIVVPPGDAPALANALNSMKDEASRVDMGHRARAAFEERYQAGIALEAWSKLVEAIGGGLCEPTQ